MHDSFLPGIGTVCFIWRVFSLSPCSSDSDVSKVDISALLTHFSTVDGWHDRLFLDPMDLIVYKEKELICTLKYGNCIYFLSILHRKIFGQIKTEGKK